MKKWILIVLIIITVGCSEEESYSNTPDFMGVVVSFEDNNQIQMNIKSGNITEDGYNDQILISVEDMTDLENLETGDVVKIWIEGQILDTQPPQAKLGKHEIKKN
ncbi:DUF3221 domain-containing protein [Gracilibacillus lacisalsi]|uniref:DUF3221 domain-containing protein n=1 Tax=Gracilibacillus lacisalsi TaxID=393087 RepID=UPI00036B51E1|nr:DUF3221 domain-containing protein [Gracilibacillus lacisalsi]